MITVLMKTYCADKLKLEEAIYSFIRQKCDCATLKIINTHPERLKLDKGYPNIEVWNRREIFGNDEQDFDCFLDKMVWQFRLVDTPYWTILDDDDLLCDWHLRQFVEVLDGLPDFEKQNSIKLMTQTCFLSIRNEMTRFKKTYGWVRCLYSRVSMDEVLAALKIHKDKGRGDAGFDTELFDMRKWFTVNYEYPYWLPSYIVRRGDRGRHLSQSWMHRYDDNFWLYEKMTGNYRDNNAEAAAKKIGVINPHWEKDYNDDALKFLRENENDASSCVL